MTNDQTLQELPDSELFAYLENEAPSEIVQQIESSEYYKQRANELAVEQQLLQQTFFRQNCPDSMKLGEYCLGQLNDIEAKNINQHLDGCPHCTRELTIFNGFLGEGKSKVSILDQIKIFIGRLISGIENTDFLSKNSMQVNRRIAISLRGEDESSVPLIYQTDNDIQVILNVLPTKNNLKNLVGLVIGAPKENFRVDLWLEDMFVGSFSIEPKKKSTSDEGWNFTITDLKEGTYELLIKGPNLLVHIQSFII